VYVRCIFRDWPSWQRAGVRSAIVLLMILLVGCSAASSTTGTVQAPRQEPGSMSVHLNGNVTAGFSAGGR
jgi:hypothetical protein